MMEHNFIWSRTLLSALLAAPAVKKHLDKLISLRAIKVPGVGVELQSDYDGTYQQVEKILGFIETKKRVFCLIHIVHEILSKVHIKYRKALYLRYKYNKTSSEIQQIMGCTMRTYFRYLQQGIKQFDKIRQDLGYTDEYFEQNYADDVWLLNLKQKNADKYFRQNHVLGVSANIVTNGCDICALSLGRTCNGGDTVKKPCEARCEAA